MPSPDPFDALAEFESIAATAAGTVLQPSNRFRRELRGRLATELGLTEAIADIEAPARRAARVPNTTPQEITMTDIETITDQPAPVTINVLIPYLCCNNAAAAMTFYATVLGATETVRMVGDDGRVGHAEMHVGGAAFYLADEYPEMDVLSPTTIGGTSVNLQLRVVDVDGAFAAAIDAGAIGLRPPSDQFYGERTATFVDPFGHKWTLATQIEAISNDEMAARSVSEGFESSFGDVAADGTAADPSADPATAAVVEVGYYTIGVADVDKAATFFGGLFGWESEPATAGSVGGSYRHVGNTTMPLGFTDNEEAGKPHLYYRVVNVASYVAKVRELGGKVVSQDEYASGGAASCLDDQGNPFDLWEPAPGY